MISRTVGIHAVGVHAAGVRAIGIRPAGQTSDTVPVPTGLPSGTIVQSGSSISPEFIAFVLGGVVIVGSLAYFLTRAPAADNEETRARAVARARYRR